MSSYSPITPHYSYFLFVSFGLCCRGANSTYHTRVARSSKITGPYIGPGHTGIIEKDGKFFVSHHYYDATANGNSKLAIRPLTWTSDGWPVAGTWE